MHKYFFVVVLCLVAGCASFAAPKNEFRVTEYAGEAGVALFGDAVIGGVRVIQGGAVDACVVYTGEHATVRSRGCRTVLLNPPDG